MLLLETDTSVHSCRASFSGRVEEKALDTRVSRNRTPSSTRLRSNLLRKLGIPPSALPKESKLGEASRVSLLSHAKRQCIPLKNTNDEAPCKNKVASSCRTSNVFQVWGSFWTGGSHSEPQNLLGESPTSHTSMMSSSTIGFDDEVDTERHVHFNEDVQVTLIPTRHEYSSRIRRFLWDTPENMHIQIIRNTLEFTADGWDSKGCLEEDEHYYNPQTSEYIHPVHLEIAQMPPEEQQHLVPAGYVNPALAASQKGASKSR